MVGHVQDRYTERQDLVHLIISILVFGSIWGFLEATLGGFLHMIIFPNKGAIMSGIGVATMTSALAIYRKPGMLLGIGIVAALFKVLDVWLFLLPVNSIHVINPAMSIIIESLVFSLVAMFLRDKIAKNALTGIGAGVLVGLVSAIAWVYFAIYVMNAPQYARVVFTAGEFIANGGVAQAAFSGIFLPVGYLIGARIESRSSSVSISRPLYYAASAVIICLCWGISIVAMMAGL